MKAVQLAALSTSELVDRFVSITLGQFDAERRDEIAKYNRLYDDMVQVTQELKARSGDQRRSLVPLLTHKNPQVRLMAAQFTLLVAPTESRLALKELSDRNIYPQAADARGTLWALERGDRIPE